MLANEAQINNKAATPTTYSNISDTFQLSESFENQLVLEPAQVIHKQPSQGNSTVQAVKVVATQREFGRELTNDIS